MENFSIIFRNLRTKQTGCSNFDYGKHFLSVSFQRNESQHLHAEMSPLLSESK